MMVSPISAVRFCANEQKVDLAREGAHTKPRQEAAAAENAEPKKSSTGKKVLKTVIGLAVVAAALAALPKVFNNAIKILPEAELKDAKFMQKAGHYLAQVGEGISNYTYRPIMNLFKGKAAAEVAEAVETVA